MTAGQLSSVGRRLRKRAHTHALFNQKEKLSQVCICIGLPDCETLGYLLVDKMECTLYTCCRDGMARENQKARKTDQTRKSFSGSRKLSESYCLARMTMQKRNENGKVQVTYIPTHTNHSLGLAECKYIPLPKSIRWEIEEKFASGMRLERIMDGKERGMLFTCKTCSNTRIVYIDIRAELGSRQQREQFDSQATRRQFITRQDCRNVCRRIRNFSIHRHTNDAISDDAMIGRQPQS